MNTYIIETRIEIKARELDEAVKVYQAIMPTHVPHGVTNVTTLREELKLLVDYVTGLIVDRLGFIPSIQLIEEIHAGLVNDFDSRTTFDEKEIKQLWYFIIHEVQNGYHIDIEEENNDFDVKYAYIKLVEEWEEQQ